MSDSNALDSMTNIIYRHLFGLSRVQVIQQAKKRAGDDWNYIGWVNDDDSAARDWMTIEALDALSAVERNITARINKIEGYITPAQLRALTKYVVSQHPKVQNVWQPIRPDNKEADHDQNNT